MLIIFGSQVSLRVYYCEREVAYTSQQGRLVWTGCRAAALPAKCKAKDSAKLAFLDLVTKFHNIIIFSTSDTILAQRFLEIQQNQCFALLSCLGLEFEDGGQ